MPPLIGDKPLTPAERTKRWREKNPTKAKAVQQAYNERHPGRRNEISRAYYARNAEQEKQRSLAWRAGNPDAVREHRRRSHYNNYAADILRMAARRAKKRQFVISSKDVRRLMSRPCTHCGATENLHVDHIIPISRGGRHSIGNLQMLCATCNLSKKNKTMTEWRAWLAKTK